MARLAKERLEESLYKYDGAILYDTDDPIYDKELKIVIHGSPVIDGRVKMGKSGVFYNPQKNEMKRLFKPLYSSDDLLQGVIIDKLMKVKMDLYFMPTLDMAKLFGVEAINSERFPSIVVKDNDNAEKVHWDILHDYNFKVVLDDNLIIENTTRKFMSAKERVEIKIQFCSDNNNIHEAYDKIIQKNLKYIYMKIHPKFLRMNNIVDASNILKFHFYLLGVQERYNLAKQKTYKKTLRKTLDWYPKECVMAICHELKVKGDYLKLNKDDMLDFYIDFLTKDRLDDYINFYNKDISENKTIIEGGIHGNIK